VTRITAGPGLLAHLLRKPFHGIALNKHFAGDGCERRMSFQASDRSHPGRTIPSEYIRRGGAVGCKQIRIFACQLIGLRLIGGNSFTKCVTLITSA
jgi:hypothetical protein